MTERAALAGLERDELAELLSGLKEPAYRADQVLDWFYKRRAESFDAMTNLPSALRDKLVVVARNDETVLDAESP